MLGTLTVINDTVRGSWTDSTGATLTKDFVTEREAVMHIAKSCAIGLRFMISGIHMPPGSSMTACR
jgi:hypothetical protein